MSEVETYSFKIDEDFLEERMDRVLAQLMEETSRNSIQKLIEDGNVSVNGRQITVKKQRLKIGDIVELIVNEPSVLDVVPEDIPIDIIYEDQDLLVVNKAKGMVVHPAAGNYTGTLVNAILYHCEGRLSSINGVVRPGIVHRIDKDTSGLLVVAKNDRAHGALAEQLASHSMKREYHAVVYNNFVDDSGKVIGPIGRDPKNRLRMAVTSIYSKEAVTHFQVLERFGRFTYIEARLETGRTHQIRVHMAHINHPLLGDGLYGPRNKAMNVEGQVLHAKTLGFIHPTSNRLMEFDCPIPMEFNAILEKLRK